jgi:hypothetical protein
MKKLLLVLLVVTLASFLFVGCIPSTPAEGEGEGEGETEVVVTIGDAVVLDGKTYVSCGTHSITVTFPAPVVGYADVWISNCAGDYSPDGVYSKDMYDDGTTVVLFPDATKTVWTGSGYFGECNGGCTPCCASYVSIWAGECEDEACIWFPVIVDSLPPYATIEICIDSCTCEGCALTLSSTSSSLPCEEDTANCGDDCSGLASWSISIFDKYPFDNCCEIPCEESIFNCSGTSCPIECTTDCLTDDLYYVIVNLIDYTGNEVAFGTQVDLDLESCNALLLTPMDPSDCLDEPPNSSFEVCEELAALVNLTMAVDPSESGTATDLTNTSPYIEGYQVSVLAEPSQTMHFCTGQHRRHL